MSLFSQFVSLKEKVLQTQAIHQAEEWLLQLLFPRVCPVCGEILKLPTGWSRVLSKDFRAKAAPPFGSSFVSNPQTFHEYVKYCRQILICPNCYQELNPIKEPSCAKCSRPLDDPAVFYCDVCSDTRLSFDAGAALWVHGNAARKIIYDLKFHNKRDNADLIGFEMALRFKEHLDLWDVDILIPVPLHKKRLRERGFNQAQLIAESFSYWLNALYGIQLPVDSGYLFRVEKTRPQRTLQTSMRSKNVRSAFQVARQPDVVGNTNEKFHKQKPLPTVHATNQPYRSVLLIDDIFTSGATINACAKTLKRSGCKRVFFFTASIV